MSLVSFSCLYSIPFKHENAQHFIYGYLCPTIRKLLTCLEIRAFRSPYKYSIWTAILATQHVFLKRQSSVKCDALFVEDSPTVSTESK
jgi:hypothetical protein